MKSILFGAAILAATATGSFAQSCGGTYEVVAGDTLSGISEELYSDARKWSVIYNANLTTIGKSPNRIRIGQKFNVPCVNGQPVGLEGAVAVVQAASGASATVASNTVAANVNGDSDRLAVRLLTADDYAPFTDRGALNEGLVTEIVHSTMKNAPNVSDYKVYWVNDWSAHLSPMLSDKVMDLGFPWLRPDCQSSPDRYRCKNFEFSDPMFEMLVLLFADLRKPFVFEKDEDVIGKTLCRPKGYFTHDLDKGGRNWLADGLIKLEQPVNVSDCFEMLDQGKVDAVALNEFTGRQAIKDLGIESWVEVVQSRPLSIEGLHLVVHKSHPDAAALIRSVNEGLAKIKDTGGYQGIIDVHMSKIWSEL